MDHSIRGEFIRKSGKLVFVEFLPQERLLAAPAVAYLQTQILRVAWMRMGK